MDLLAFDRATLYFDETDDPEVHALIRRAGEAYGSDLADNLLAQAQARDPQSLLVRVAQYRYHFYRHGLAAALDIAYDTIGLVARRLGLPGDWRAIGPDDLATAAEQSMPLLRFHLCLIKAAGYLEMRRGRLDAGRELLEKLVDLDRHDRLGGRALLELCHPQQEEPA